VLCHLPIIDVLPNITQTPVGPIIKGNKVILTCTIEGGNPVATMAWSCDGATQITGI
jgi:hypothetical protein